MTMQLEFAQAMKDFKTMFPDMEKGVIEAVLRANQGAVDATIDQLLAMSTDNQNEKLRNELDANVCDGDINSDCAKQAAQLSDTTNRVGAEASSHHLSTGASTKQRPVVVKTSIRPPENGNSTPSKQPYQKEGRRWNPPILRPLPTYFLRIVPSPSGLQDSVRDFDLPDEQFALMLQNEEFMNQLRWNQEFMMALEKEQSGKERTEDDAAFKERLKNMGKMSRKKFLQLARVFTWQRNKKVTTAKQIDSLPLKEEPSDDESPVHNKEQQRHQQ